MRPSKRQRLTPIALVKLEPGTPGAGASPSTAAASTTERKGRTSRGSQKSVAKGTPAKAARHPFPKWVGPSAAACARAVAELESLHGAVESENPNHNQRSVLDSLVRTMLSQNTTDVTSKRAFNALKVALPSWEEARVAPVEAVADAVRCCGLADIRAERIQGVLNTLVAENGGGPPSLEYVRALSNAAVKKELLRFKGVGPKTVACVLMFCLRRAEFPVDTHVWRIAKSLKWVPERASREHTYALLNGAHGGGVPDSLKFALHVLLVRHGKCCSRCAKNGKPRQAPLGPCPLTFSSSIRSANASAASAVSAKAEARSKTETAVKSEARP